MRKPETAENTKKVWPRGRISVRAILLFKGYY